MQKLTLFLLLLFTSSCATKYILPGNRFITPETNGGAFKGQFEIQQTTANNLKVNGRNGTVTDGVLYENVSRTGFMYANSFFDNFDLFWTHIGGSNSLLGGKLQFIGGSRGSKSAGHKLAVAAAYGSNEHEPEDASIEFKLSSKEAYLLYGYRFGEFVMTYANFIYSQYDFSGTIKKADPALIGLHPNYSTNIIAFSGGLELSYGPVVSKLECTYQQITTTGTNIKSNFITGWTIGAAW